MVMRSAPWIVGILLAPALGSASDGPNEFDVTQFGAACNWDGRTGIDDSTAIQAAISAASKVGGTVLIPRACRIDRPLLLKVPVALRGVGMRTSTLVAGAPMPTMIEVAEIRPGSNDYFEFADFELRGNGNVKNGVRALTISHSKFNRIKVSGTSVHALWIGWGWCNDIVDVTITSNRGSPQLQMGSLS